MLNLPLRLLAGPGLACVAILLWTAGGCSNSQLPGPDSQIALSSTALLLEQETTTTADQISAAAEAGDLPLRANPLRTGKEPVTAPATPSAVNADPPPAISKTAVSKTESPQPMAGKTESTDLPAAAAAKGEAAVPPKVPGKGKRSGKPFDPIKENGPIFEGWPKPKLALVLTGRQDGYLEPCGCAGLDRMKGGLSRRHVMFEQLRKDGWPLAALDVGGLIKGFGKQTELKFQITVEGMRKMGYDAMTLGAGDLRLPVQELVTVVAGVPNKESPFVSANVGLFGFDAGITPRKKVIQAGGLKLGVTAVLGKTAQKETNTPDVEMVDPAAALEKVLLELRKEKCDLLILLAHATLEETESLAKRFPDFAIVVTSSGPAEPPLDQARLVGRSRVVEVGEKGMNAIVLGLYEASGGGLEMRYQRVPLDSRFAQSPDMKALMRSYEDQLRDLGLEGLNIRPAPHPQAALLGKYVGSQKCESCHEPSYEVWKKSKHAKAFKTLVEADPPRNYDPECLSCHVVGWHPTRHFPYVSGYLSKEKTPSLVNVGCESCHGPGEAHCDAELPGKTDEALKQKLRKAVTVTKAEAEKNLCYECHDLDNSPDFDFPSYWPDVEHREKE